MEKKGLFHSKIFWLAVINLVIAVLGGLTHKEFAPGTAEEIVSLDWGNIGQALVSLAMILARWFFTSAKIWGFTAVLLAVFWLDVPAAQAARPAAVSDGVAVAFEALAVPLAPVAYEAQIVGCRRWIYVGFAAVPQIPTHTKIPVTLRRWLHPLIRWPCDRE